MRGMQVKRWDGHCKTAEERRGEEKEKGEKTSTKRRRERRRETVPQSHTTASISTNHARSIAVEARCQGL